MDLETAVAVKDLALRMGNAAVYKEGGIAGEDYPNHLKLTDVDEASMVMVFSLAYVKFVVVFVVVFTCTLLLVYLPCRSCPLCLLCPLGRHEH